MNHKRKNAGITSLRRTWMQSAGPYKHQLPKNNKYLQTLSSDWGQLPECCVWCAAAHAVFFFLLVVYMHLFTRVHFIIGLNYCGNRWAGWFSVSKFTCELKCVNECRWHSAHRHGHRYAQMRKRVLTIYANISFAHVYLHPGQGPDFRKYSRCA